MLPKTDHPTLTLTLTPERYGGRGLNEGNLEFVERYRIVGRIEKRGDGGEGNQFGESAVELERQRLRRDEKGRRPSTIVQDSTRGCVRAGVWHCVGGRRVGKKCDHHGLF